MGILAALVACSPAKEADEPKPEPQDEVVIEDDDFCWGHQSKVWPEYPENAGEPCGPLDAWVKDCDGICQEPGFVGRPGDGYCESFFYCAAIDYDDCDAPGTPCSEGEVVDCFGACRLVADRLGDGACFDRLDCDAFEADGGDCDPGVPGEGCLIDLGAGAITAIEGLVDCDGKCIPSSRPTELGCDEALNCEALDYDSGDCVEGVPGDRCGRDGLTAVYDCEGKCNPNGPTQYICDPDFNCEALGFDAGECLEETPGDPCEVVDWVDDGSARTVYKKVGVWSCFLTCEDDCLSANDVCNPEFNCEALGFDGGDCEPAP